MLAFRRLLLAALATLVAFLPVLPASAATEDDLQAAKQRLAAARDAAVDARTATYNAEEKLHVTEDRIADLEVSIQELERRAEELRVIVRERALYAYTHAGSDIDIVIGTENPLLAARGKTLIDLSNQRDHTAARQLAVINGDLRDQTAQLREEEGRQRAVRDQLASRNAEFESALDNAQSAASTLQTQYDREIAELQAKQAAAAQQAEAEEQARLDAQLTQLQRERATLAAGQPVANPATADLSPGQVIANPLATAPSESAPPAVTPTSTPAPTTPTPTQDTSPPPPPPPPPPAPEPAPAPSPGPAVGGFMCPVFGATYTDDFGGARGHGGIDMFVPEGTPLYATVSGSVRYVANEGAGGNTVYLNGGGNSYFYAHLSQFVGGARSVSQGEIIGYSGMTGNASGPHLHFEIRAGGDNGTKINPYPTLRNAGC
jgi:murein DD-endopeptidase MepM/ murein hydrolase activator NlpD